jgi:hypothetical protein
MLANVAMGVVAYTVGALFLARMASDKWHPDGMGTPFSGVAPRWIQECDCTTDGC